MNRNRSASNRHVWSEESTSLRSCGTEELSHTHTHTHTMTYGGVHCVILWIREALSC